MIRGIHKKNPRNENERVSKPMSPARVIAGSFLAIILVGTLLLCLPISSKNGIFTPIIDAMFTATTATCVTGLVVVDTFSHWSLFGQGVILLLLQIGGIGLVTLTTFFIMTLRHKIGLNNMTLVRESVNTNSLQNLNSLLRTVIGITIITELAGSLILMTRFIPAYGLSGVWISVFTAVSAYCNAGLDILGFEGPFASMIPFADDIVVNITVMMLVIIGGLGFIVFGDLRNYRKSKKLMLHTRIVLFATAFLIVFGAVIFLAVEYNNPKTIGEMPIWQKIMASFFQSVSTRTAGFCTIDQGALSDTSKIISSMLMFIGAAPGSTGGGVKVTTFMVIVMTVVATLRNKTETTIMRRKVDHKVVYKSLSIVVIALCVIAVTTTVIVGENDVTMINGIFEAVSAFGTVGLSSGITPQLGIISKIVVMLTMFVGRVGPFSFIIAITLRQLSNPRKFILPEGQIMVG